MATFATSPTYELQVQVAAPPEAVVAHLVDKETIGKGHGLIKKVEERERIDTEEGTRAIIDFTDNFSCCCGYCNYPLHYTAVLFKPAKVKIRILVAQPVKLEMEQHQW